MVHLRAMPLRDRPPGADLPPAVCAPSAAGLPPNGRLPLAADPLSATRPPPGDIATAGDTSAPAKRPHATYKVSQERVVQVAQLLARQISKGHIKRLLRERDGIRHRQAERILRKARDFLLERAARPKSDIISEILEIYQGIIRDPESSTRDRLDATEAIRSMFGLDAPRKIAATTPDGESAAAGLAQVNIQMLSLTDAHKESLLAAAFALRGLPGQVVEGQVAPPDVAGSDGS
jgi:hypothetical protein